MIGWGIALIIIGAGSLLLPMLGYQFTLMELVDDQPYAGIVVAIVGAALVLLGMNRQSGTTVETRQAAQPSTGSAGSTTSDEEPRPQP